MNIEEKVKDIVNKAKSDPKVMENLKKDPINTVEGILGVDLPDEQIKKVADAVMAKINLGAIGDNLKGLFGKK